jgi:hypothetical protein
MKITKSSKLLPAYEHAKQWRGGDWESPEDRDRLATAKSNLLQRLADADNLETENARLRAQLTEFQGRIKDILDLLRTGSPPEAWHYTQADWTAHLNSRAASEIARLIEKTRLAFIELRRYRANNTNNFQLEKLDDYIREIQKELEADE